MMRPHIEMFIRLMMGVALLLVATLPSIGDAEASLAAAVLPASRSVQVGTTATAFGILINGGTTTGTSCSIGLGTTIPATFSYQTTDPTTNALTGSPNTPVDLAAGQSQTFIVSLTPTAEIPPTDVPLSFDCTNTDPAPSTVGLNTLLLSASNTPVSDIVALAITPTNDGIVHLPGATGGLDSTGIFAVASINLGATGTMTVSADTGSVSLPLAITLCQTNLDGDCLTPPPSSTETTEIVANTTPSFAVFVEGLGFIPFDPSVNRIFIRFKDQNGITRGSTSVAVQTDGPSDGPSPLVITSATSLPPGTVNQPYEETITVSGGTAPFSWSVIAGSLPCGLPLNASTGQISGTPTIAGTFTGTIQVQDSSIIQQSAQLPFICSVFPEEIFGVLTIANAPASVEGTFVARFADSTKFDDIEAEYVIEWEDTANFGNSSFFEEGHREDLVVGQVMTDDGLALSVQFNSDDEGEVPPGPNITWVCVSNSDPAVALPCQGVTINRSDRTMTFVNTVLTDFLSLPPLQPRNPITLNGILTFPPFEFPEVPPNP